jgi:DNA primase
VTRITSESIEAVREAADLSEVVGRYTELTQSGSQLVGLCPFHQEYSPSFAIDRQNQIYHCFGCSVGGDVFSFVMEKTDLSFTEAVERLADDYGIDLRGEEGDPD